MAKRGRGRGRGRGSWKRGRGRAKNRDNQSISQSDQGSELELSEGEASSKKKIIQKEPIETIRGRGRGRGRRAVEKKENSNEQVSVSKPDEEKEESAKSAPKGEQKPNKEAKIDQSKEENIINQEKPFIIQKQEQKQNLQEIVKQKQQVAGNMDQQIPQEPVSKRGRGRGRARNTRGKAKQAETLIPFKVLISDHKKQKQQPIQAQQAKNEEQAHQQKGKVSENKKLKTKKAVAHTDLKFYNNYYDSIYEVLKEEEALQKEGYFIFDRSKPEYQTIVADIKRKNNIK